MRTDPKPIDWFQTMAGFGLTLIALALLPWALHFGREDGRWWLTAVALAAIVAAEAMIAFAIFGLRHLRATKHLRAQRPNE
jgi:hypothetical protein